MSRARECGSKQRHPDRGAALRHFQSLVRYGTAPGRMSVYRCPHCGAWHVGHRKRRRR